MTKDKNMNMDEETKEKIIITNIMQPVTTALAMTKSVVAYVIFVDEYYEPHIYHAKNPFIEIDHQKARDTELKFLEERVRELKR